MSAIASITDAATLEAGLYRGLSFDAYQAIPAVSRSTLWAMRRSPAHPRVAREETDALRFAELKVGKNKPTSEQMEWLNDLMRVQGSMVAFWRPEDMDAIEKVLM